MSLRHAYRPRGAQAHHDKAVPTLYGIPVPIASAAKQQEVSQQDAVCEGDTAGRYGNAKAAHRSHLDTLKHIAAGIAISAALFTGAST